MTVEPLFEVRTSHSLMIVAPFPNDDRPIAVGITMRGTRRLVSLSPREAADMAFALYRAAIDAMEGADA